MSQEAAEAIGLKVLLFIVGDEARLTRFLGETGLDPNELKARAGEGEMLAALLGHLLEDESQLLVFTAGERIDPVDVHAARARLGGAPTWDSV
jgi:hypothetical protein